MKKRLLFLGTILLLASCSSPTTSGESASHNQESVSSVTSSSSITVPTTKSEESSLTPTEVIESKTILITFEDGLIKADDNKNIEVIDLETKNAKIEKDKLFFSSSEVSQFAFETGFNVKHATVTFDSAPVKNVCIGVMNTSGIKLFNDMELDGKEASYTFAATLPTNRLILQCSEAISVSSISLVER